MKRYDLNLLPVLEVLLRERSVSGAARCMGVGQPAMSSALARLRALFDDPILVRGARGMEPTPRALALSSRLRATLAEIETMIAPDRGFDPAAAKRVVRVSGGDYVGMTVLPGLASRLTAGAPGIDLRFRFLEKDAALVALDDGTIDLALMVNDDLAPRFASETLIEETFVGVARAGHPVLDAPVTLDRFVTYGHLLVTERADATGCVDVDLAARGVQRRVAMTVPSAALVFDILKATDMVATLPRRAAERLALSGSVRTFDLPIDTARWSMRTVWATRNMTDAGLTWLRAELQAAAAKA